MPTKHHKPEQIIAKLRQIEVGLGRLASTFSAL